MPETMEITIYKFDELEPSAKERARDWWRSGDTDIDYDYDDFVHVGKILGIEIDTKPVKLMGGGTRQDPIIYWSGFSSQGDGACFEGRYSYARKAHKLIRAYAPTDEKLHAIADGLLDVQRKHGYRIEARVKHHGRYYHELCTAIDVTDSSTGNDIIDGDGLVMELLRDFMRWIYRRLESEYEWRNADEQVDDSIRANEYTFTADGKREG